MTEREALSTVRALKLARRALWFAHDDGYSNELSQEALTAIKEALMSVPDGAQPEQEPVTLSEGKKLILVDSSFDDLMYWLERCESKGHLENCSDLIEPWEKFCDSYCVWTDHHPDCKLAEQEPAGHGGRPMTLRECMEAEEPEKKPVASVYIKDGRLFGSHRDESKPFLDGQYGLWPIESPPPQRPSRSDIKPLTDEEINEFFQGMEPNNGFWLSFARAIEAAHGIIDPTELKE